MPRICSIFCPYVSWNPSDAFNSSLAVLTFVDVASRSFPKVSKDPLTGIKLNCSDKNFNLSALTVITSENASSFCLSFSLAAFIILVIE